MSVRRYICRLVKPIEMLVEALEQANHQKAEGEIKHQAVAQDLPRGGALISAHALGHQHANVNAKAVENHHGRTAEAVHQSGGREFHSGVVADHHGVNQAQKVLAHQPQGDGPDKSEGSAKFLGLCCHFLSFS